MKRIRDFLSRPTVTVTLLALALVLLAGSTVGGARAILNRESELLKSSVKVNNIGVALKESNDGENWTVVSGNNALMTNMLGTDKKLLVGKKYTEMLCVSNDRASSEQGYSPIDEYVRVSVYKYWVDKNGNKTAEMNSDWIKLEFVTGNGWSIDTDSSTEERTVLYYSPVLAGATENARGMDSEPFLRSITIDEAVTHKVTKTPGKVGNVNTITWTYDYNGCRFCLDVYVDAVQTHNAADAKTSAWGVNK